MDIPGIDYPHRHDEERAVTDLAKQMRDDAQTIFDLRMEVFRGEQRAERLRGFIEDAVRMIRDLKRLAGK